MDIQKLLDGSFHNGDYIEISLLPIQYMAPHSGVDCDDCIAHNCYTKNDCDCNCDCESDCDCNCDCNCDCDCFCRGTKPGD